MKPSPSEKVEIIRLVEESYLPARRTLAVRRQMVWDIFDIAGQRLWFI
jgi:hypothetical protein